MKLYRVGGRDNYKEHQGYSYFTSRKAALKDLNECNRRFPSNGQPLEVEEIEFDLTKKGVLGLLMQWASHADNG